MGKITEGAKINTIKRFYIFNVQKRFNKGFKNNFIKLHPFFFLSLSPFGQRH